MARSDAVFSALRLIGAAYLVLLGVRKIRERKSLAEFGAAAVDAEVARPDLPRGFYVGATNPKGLMIFTAVLPQFVDRSQGHVTAQLALLGLDLHRDRAAVRRRLGVCVGHRARLAGQLAETARAADRRRRAGADRPRRRAGDHRPQE